jgi:polyhydroxybutyrate depolymerase
MKRFVTMATIGLMVALVPTITLTSANASPTLLPFTVGGQRPAAVFPPSKYQGPAPILISLHGYTSSGAKQEAYLKMRSILSKKGIIYVTPDGTPDGGGNRFWNASKACCNFYGSGVDDVKYLMGLVDQVNAKFPVDRKRIYFVGHSNGGFMAFKLACERSDQIAGIVSFAGSMNVDRATCPAKKPISVLLIHGTADSTILPAGSSINGNGYASDQSNLNFWKTKDKCLPTIGLPKFLRQTDYDSSIAGKETKIYSFNCSTKTNLQYWSIADGLHVPAVNSKFSGNIVDWLLAQSK